MSKFLIRCHWCRLAAVVIATTWAASAAAWAQESPACAALPDHPTLRAVLQAVVSQGKEANRGVGEPALYELG
jgi:hypothetical protein